MKLLFPPPRFMSVNLSVNLGSIKTLIILRVNKHFWGKICMSVLFHNCFPFSIKIPVKYSSAGCKLNGQNSLISQAFKRCFFKITSTSEIEALKVQSCKLKKHWKMIAYVFQKYLGNFAFQLFIILL